MARIPTSFFHPPQKKQQAQNRPLFKQYSTNRAKMHEDALAALGGLFRKNVFARQFSDHGFWQWLVAEFNLPRHFHRRYFV